MGHNRKSGQKRAKKVQNRKKKQQKKENQNEQGGWEPAGVGGIPDRRLMEKMMAETLGFDEDRSEEESQADTLFSKALQTTSPQQRLKHLEACLKLNPRHIDAVVELASLSENDDTQLGLLNRAVAIGEDELQEELREHVGDFWGLFHTRPFMRAKRARAELFLSAGELESAVAEMEDLLRLNPSDNQGVRWELLDIYCRVDQFEKAEELLEQYEEDASPFMDFTRLLVRFRKQGDTPDLRDSFRERTDRNPHIVPRMLDPSLIQHGDPPFFSLGSPEEADLYCRQFLGVWKATPGAMTWLRSVARDLPEFGEEDTDFDIKKEIQKARTKVKNLPQDEETWICDAAEIPDDPGEAWILTVIEKSSQEPICLESGEDPLSTDTVLWGLLNLMLDPEEGEPRKPASIEFISPELHSALQTRFERLEIACEFTEERPDVLDFVQQSAAVMGQPVAVDLEEVRQAPQSSETWQVDWRDLNQWLPSPETGEPVQPWVVFVLDEDSIVLSQQMLLSAPDRADLENVIGQAVLTTQRPDSPEPRRPRRIHVPSSEHLLDLKPVAEQIGVECQVASCEEMEVLFAGLSEHISGTASGITAMIEIPEVAPEVVGEFYDAAAEYYNSRIWNSTPPSTVVEVACSALMSKPWYAVTMGQMGEELGLMLFDNPSNLQTLMAMGPDDPPSSGQNEMRGLVLSLNEKQMISPEDVAAAEQFGWPVPGPEAWPMGYFVAEGGMQTVNRDELQFLTVAARAITRQLQSKKPSMEHSLPLEGETVQVTTKRS